MRKSLILSALLLGLASCGPTPAPDAPATLASTLPTPQYVQQADNLLIEVYADHAIVRLKQFRTRAQYRWTTELYQSHSKDLWITNRIYAGQANNRVLPAGDAQGLLVEEIPY